MLPLLWALSLSIGSKLQDPSLSGQFNIWESDDFYGRRINETLNFVDEAGYAPELTGEGITVRIIDDTLYGAHGQFAHFDSDNSWNNETSSHDPWIANSGVSWGTMAGGIIAAKWDTEWTAGIAPNVSLSCWATGTQSNLFFARTVEGLRTGGSMMVILLGRKIGMDCNNTCAHAPDRADVNTALASITLNTVTVVSTGIDGGKYGNTNFWQLRRDPRIVVVADLTHYGTATAWSTRGTSVMLCAHSGGSSSVLDENAYFPGLDVLDGPPDLGRANGNPIGLGAPAVAGLAALLKNVNNQFTWRDIQMIMACTANTTDYTHPSWVKNAAGIWYSDTYGFGKPSIRDALFFARSYQRLPALLSGSVRWNETAELIPLRHKDLEVELEIEETIRTIEYVTLSLTLGDLDYRFLKVILVSPQGTEAILKRFSTDKKVPDEAHFTVRNFLGESAAGVWILRLIYEHVGKNGMLLEATLNVYGSSQKIINNQRPGNNHNTWTPLGWPVNFDLDTNETECGVPLNVTMSSRKATVPLLMGDQEKTSRWPLEPEFVVPSTIKKITIPCHYADNFTFQLKSESYSNTSITVYYGESAFIRVHNPHTPYTVQDPAPYEVIPYSGEPLYIPVSVAMDFSRYPDGAQWQFMHITLYDMVAEKVIYENFCESRNMSISINRTCTKCLLSVVPVWTPSNRMTCVQMIQPFSIVDEGEMGPGKWVVKLDASCPIPPGIVVHDVTPTLPPVNRAPALVVGVLFFISFAVFMIAYFVINRKPSKTTMAESLVNAIV